jgi:hypothetical protein
MSEAERRYKVALRYMQDKSLAADFPLKREKRNPLCLCHVDSRNISQRLRSKSLCSM